MIPDHSFAAFIHAP
jgi:transcription elongation factor Elf1